MLGLAASAESRLQHPVAEAIRARTEEDKIEVPECQEVQYRVGQRGGGEDQRLLPASGAANGFCGENSIDTRRAMRDQQELNERGYSSLMLAIDGKVAGLIPYADQVRAESLEVVQALHALGIKNTVMLTGDNGTVARARIRTAWTSAICGGCAAGAEGGVCAGFAAPGSFGGDGGGRH
jgi:cation transport ATPase